MLTSNILNQYHVISCVSNNKVRWLETMFYVIESRAAAGTSPGTTQSPLTERGIKCRILNSIYEIFDECEAWPLHRRLLHRWDKIVTFSSWSSLPRATWGAPSDCPSWWRSSRTDHTRIWSWPAPHSLCPGHAPARRSCLSSSLRTRSRSRAGRWSSWRRCGRTGDLERTTMKDEGNREEILTCVLSPCHEHWPAASAGIFLPLQREFQK